MVYLTRQHLLKLEEAFISLVLEKTLTYEQCVLVLPLLFFCSLGWSAEVSWWPQN